MDYPAPADGEPDFPGYPYRTHGTAFVDFDEDGDLDLLVGNGGPSSQPETREPNRLFRNDIGNHNNWIRLHLVGQTSNRDGIGARITVRSIADDGSVNKRHTMVKGFSGFGGNNAIDPHIGLGKDIEIAEISIRWPSGIRQKIYRPAINGELTVTESFGLSAKKVLQVAK